MKILRALLALLPTLLLADAAMALSSSSTPPKFQIPWANSASAPYVNAIPVPSQIGISNCRASLTDGFPPLTFQPVSSGGCAPFGADFNGVFKQITQWSQWQGASGPVFYDVAFSGSVNGYPKGAVLANLSNPFCYWISTAENNTSNPDTGGANWTPSCPGGGLGTATSTGSANAQVVTTTPFVVRAGSQVCWIPGFSNSGSLQVNINGAGLQTVFQTVPGAGYVNLVGGEVRASAPACVVSDGSNWSLEFSAQTASLARQDQTLSGGANVVANNIGTLASTTYTIDCGLSPLQYLTNNGAITLAAPANDGSCLVMITNGALAGAVTFSGFTTNSNTGEALTTVNGNKFAITVWRINTIASYVIKALQ